MLARQEGEANINVDSHRGRLLARLINKADKQVLFQHMEGFIRLLILVFLMVFGRMRFNIVASGGSLRLLGPPLRSCHVIALAFHTPFHLNDCEYNGGVLIVATQ